MLDVDTPCRNGAVPALSEFDYFYLAVFCENFMLERIRIVYLPL